MPSEAFAVFEKNAVKESNSLVDIFRERNTGRGPNTDYGLLHGGLILLVSGWETYCENISKISVGMIADNQEKEIIFDTIPDNAKREIIKYVNEKKIDGTDILESRHARLPDDGWKKLFVEMLDDYLWDFHTPKFSRGKGKDLNGLFRMFLNSNIEEEIQNLTARPNIISSINNIIRVRGDIAHSGKPSQGDRVDADTFAGYLKIIQSSCAAIESMIASEFQERYDFLPWRITNKISQHLPGRKN